MITNVIGDNASSFDSDNFIETLSAATLAMKEERSSGRQGESKVAGDLVRITSASRISVIGDIHGDSATLAKILDKLDYDTFLSEPRNKMIFLGDYVDRGSDSVGVLHTVAALKARHSDSVILLRGNHESPQELPFASHDLPAAVIGRFGAQQSPAIYRRIMSFFDMLSLGVVVEGAAILVHGGLPVAPHPDIFQTIASARDNRIRNSWFEEILWNDPRNLTADLTWEPSRRGYGRHFGQAITNHWLQKTGSRTVIRGHEPCTGFRLDHESKVMTLFSTVEAYPKFRASYLDISQEDLRSASNAEDLLEYVHVLDS